jgi:hypothetical protein
LAGLESERKKVEELKSELSARIQLSNSWAEAATKANGALQDEKKRAKPLIEALSLIESNWSLNYRETASDALEAYRSASDAGAKGTGRESSENNRESRRKENEAESR